MELPPTPRAHLEYPEAADLVEIEKRLVISRSKGYPHPEFIEFDGRWWRLHDLDNQTKPVYVRSWPN